MTSKKSFHWLFRSPDAPNAPCPRTSKMRDRMQSLNLRFNMAKRPHMPPQPVASERVWRNPSPYGFRPLVIHGLIEDFDGCRGTNTGQNVPQNGNIDAAMRNRHCIDAGWVVQPAMPIGKRRIDHQGQLSQILICVGLQESGFERLRGEIPLLAPVIPDVLLCQFLVLVGVLRDLWNGNPKESSDVRVVHAPLPEQAEFNEFKPLLNSLPKPRTFRQHKFSNPYKNFIDIETMSV